ncbi:MAG TPA: type 4a pilus biogenesis protein PilO [Gaiellaceae bacterium]|jgi:type II secretory pathway pseudopilin PulG|nr:type 4a pilus biogenesis protein PilO [Gaiellaceae bacterium]
MRRRPSAAVIAGIVAGLLAFALVGYFLLVSPQRKKAADAKSQIVATQQQIDQYRALAAQARATPPIRIADLFRLTKAMPDDVDMAGLVLELSRVARESGIVFDSITPQGTATLSGYSGIPISLEFDGNYYELSDFLFRLRNLVRVRSGRLDAQGRLFVVDSISFSESEHSFPRINASLVVHAFVYGDLTATTAPPPAATAPGSTTGSSTTTAQTTTSLDTPPDPPGGTSAVGGGR